MKVQWSESFTETKQSMELLLCGPFVPGMDIFLSGAKSVGAKSPDTIHLNLVQHA